MNRNSRIIIFLWFFWNFIAYSQEENTIDVLETKVTIRAIDEPIKAILFNLEDKNSFSFSYVNRDIPLQKEVSVLANQLELSSVLDITFQNTLIDYLSFEDQVILIKKDDIELLEKVKKTDTTGYYYLPSLSEYNSKSTTKGNFVNLDKLLKKIINFYTKKNKSVIPEAIIDSTYANTLTPEQGDTLIVDHKKKKRKRLKLPKISLENIDITYGISTKVSSVFWTFRSKENKQDYNQNSIPDLAISLGGDIYFENQNVLTSIGLRFSHLQKTGIHTDYLINTVFPDTVLTRGYSYSENFSFLEMPLKVGFKIQSNKTHLLIQPGIILQRLLFSNVASTYRVYQNQYFTNLNANSSNNPDLSPYFDRNFATIVPGKTNIRKWNTAISLSLKIITKVNSQWKLIIGPEISYSLFSLYARDAPITQNSIQAGLGIIISPVFPYL